MGYSMHFVQHSFCFYHPVNLHHDLKNLFFFFLICMEASSTSYYNLESCCIETGFVD